MKVPSLKLLTIILFFFLEKGFCQNFTSNADGSWTVGSTWNNTSGWGANNPGNPMPGSVGSVIVNHTVVIPADMSFINTSNITVNGSLYILGDVIMDGSAALVNNGTVIVQGNLTVRGLFNLNSIGNFVVTGNLTITESGIVSSNNNMYAYGGIWMTGAGVFDGLNFWNYPDSGGTGWTGTVLPGVVGTCADDPVLCAFANDVELPIELLYLKNSIIGEYVKLQWATAMEENFDKFVVERSIDSYNFASIGEVKGLGFSRSIQNYSFIDSFPISPILYYRLVQLDYDSSIEYSKTIRVLSGSHNIEFGIYPNPVKHGEVIYFTKAVQNGTVNLISISGEIHYLLINSEEVISEIEIPEWVNPGVYVFEIVGNDERKQWLIQVF